MQEVLLALASVQPSNAAPPSAGRPRLFASTSASTSALETQISLWTVLWR